MLIAGISILAAAWFGLNAYATCRLIRCDGLEVRQKGMQAVLIWLVPAVFALVTIELVRGNSGKASGRSSEMDEYEPEDVAVQDIDYAE